MKRRDAILAAVVINAGLLAVLFATATKRVPEKRGEEMIAAPKQVKEAQLPVVRQLPPPPPPAPVFYEEPQTIAAFEEQPSILEASRAAVAAVAEEMVATAPSSTVQVVVKKGDALEKIARAHGTTVEEIMRANKMSSTRLQIGQTLKVLQATENLSSSGRERGSDRGILHRQKWR